MKRYMFVITTLANGGAERAITTLASAMVNHGKEVYIVKYFNVPEEYVPDFRVVQKSLVDGNEKEYLKLSKSQRILALRKIIKNANPDYIFPLTSPVAFAVALATVGIKATVVQSIRTNPAKQSKTRRFLRDSLVYSSKLTFVQNEDQKKYFKKKAHKKIKVLYNPVSGEMFSNEKRSKKEKFVFCTAGRLSEEKNFQLLIEAFKETFGDNKNVVLEIYGNGPLYDALEKSIVNLGMKDQIFLMGRSNSIQDVYKSSDAFVLSSNFEGMPNALIEAMANSLPCVSTDCPTGPRDLITNDVSGLLVPVNDISAMSEALKKIYAMSNDERFNMGTNAYNFIKENCIVDKIVERFIELTEAQ